VASLTTDKHFHACKCASKSCAVNDPMRLRKATAPHETLDFPRYVIRSAGIIGDNPGEIQISHTLLILLATNRNQFLKTLFHDEWRNRQEISGDSWHSMAWNKASRLLQQGG
jgi:hypothetical protein